MSCTSSNRESLANADDLPERLAAALRRHPRARSDDGRRFAPELSYGRHFGPASFTARPAAVIMLLVRRNGRWHIPLTERPNTLLHHGGQISLPGGTVEPGESSADAALRELAEELGVCSPCEMIGQLPGVYVYASDFLVTPWLAATPHIASWNPRASEVERILELPLDVLLDPQAVGAMMIDRGPISFRAPCFRFADDSIWGATAIILAELAGLLRTATAGNVPS
jgi:8-oxo-dGTP pyrophosphatase MutT (NUDIX family)